MVRLLRTLTRLVHRRRKEAEVIAENALAASGWPLFEQVVQDARFAVRTLVRNRTFTIAAVLTLGLGIGATTAVFTVIHTVLLQPLPYPDSDRIVQVWEQREGGGPSMPSDPNFEDLRAQDRSLAFFSQYSAGPVPVIVGTEAVRVMSATVSAGFFDTLGVPPDIGRTFVPDEQRFGTPHVAIVSHRFWRQHLESTRDLSAVMLRLEGRSHSITGVMPESFDFPLDVDIWVPREQWRDSPSGRTGRNAFALGRLHSDVGLPQVRQELNAIADRLKQQYGEGTWMDDVLVVPLRESLVGSVRTVLLVQLGAVGFLLFISCANVLNLLLSQMAVRGREVALRGALGAGGWRIARQFVTETSMLSLAGGALGIAIAVGSAHLVRTLGPPNLPRLDEVAVGTPVVLFAAAVSVVISLVLGLVAARRATADDLRSSLAGVGAGGVPSAGRLREALVVAQVATTLVLLVGAGLLTRSLSNLIDVDPGFRTSGLLAVRLFYPGLPDTSPLDPPEASAAAKARRVQQLDAVAERLRALPGAGDVGIADRLPLGGGNRNGLFLILQADGDVPTIEEFSQLMTDPSRTGSAEYRAASEGYFRALGIPLIEGRLFDVNDTLENPHVAVISETLARTRWPDGDSVGQRIEFGNMDGDMRPLTVVGVVGDVRYRGLDAPPVSVIYVCYRQRPQASSSFTVVLSADTGVAASVRPILSELEPEVPIEVQTIEDALGAWLQWRRFIWLLLGGFASLAAFLAVSGVYGAVSCVVSHRTREFGIRTALGAVRGQVVWPVVRRGLLLIACGTVLGGAAALGLAGTLRAFLFGVQTADPLTFVVASLLLGGVAIVACLVPARRAARVDPLVALRSG